MKKKQNKNSPGKMRWPFCNGVLRGSHSGGFSTKKEVVSNWRSGTLNMYIFLGLVSFPFLFDAFPFPCLDIFIAVFFFFLACSGSSSTFEFFLFWPVVVEGRGEMGLLRPLRVLEIDAQVVGIAGGLFSSMLVARMWEEEWLIATSQP